MDWRVILVLICFVVVGIGFAVMAVLLRNAKQEARQERAKRMILADELDRSRDVVDVGKKPNAELVDEMLENINGWNSSDGDCGGSGHG